MFQINVKGKTITKGSDFENDSVAAAIRVIAPSVSPKVFHVNTYTPLTEEQKKEIPDSQLVPHIYIKKEVEKSLVDLYLMSEDKTIRKKLFQLKKLTINLEHARGEFEKEKKRWISEKEKAKLITDAEKLKRENAASKREEERLRKYELSLEELRTADMTGTTEEKLCSSLEEFFAKKKEKDIEAEIDTLLGELRGVGTKGTVKFCISGQTGAGGHALVLHCDAEGEYSIISSTSDQSFEKAEEEYWYKYLCKKTGQTVSMISTNRQNYSIGCIFCACYTEYLLEQGMSVHGLPTKMNPDREKAMMDYVYLGLAKSYKNQDLTEPTDELLGKLFSGITEQDLRASIAECGHSADEVIQACRECFQPHGQEVAVVEQPRRRPVHVQRPVSETQRVVQFQSPSSPQRPVLSVSPPVEDQVINMPYNKSLPVSVKLAQRDFDEELKKVRRETQTEEYESKFTYTFKDKSTKEIHINYGPENDLNNIEVCIEDQIKLDGKFTRKLEVEEKAGCQRRF